MWFSNFYRIRAAAKRVTAMNMRLFRFVTSRQDVVKEAIFLSHPLAFGTDFEQQSLPRVLLKRN
jgi:hypothetical protein